MAAGALALAGCNRHDETAPKPITGADTTSTAPAAGVAATPDTHPAATPAPTSPPATPPAATGTTGTTGTAGAAAGNATAPAADSTGTSGTAGGAAADAGGDVAMGKATYNQTCVMCHGGGIAGAPKFGDKAAWAPRIAKGKATLYDHAIKGFQGQSGTMPPRGGSSATDAQVKAAVDYMVSQAK
jgi:cytochrome c5